VPRRAFGGRPRGPMSIMQSYYCTCSCTSQDFMLSECGLGEMPPGAQKRGSVLVR